MSQEEIRRIVQGAPALKELVIASLPDCLLVNHWSRGTSREPEQAAAQAGMLFSQAQDALQSVGPTAGVRLITVEADDGLFLICRIGRSVAAAFLFERTAPLGLVRIQARQLAEGLRTTLRLPPTRDLPAPAALRPPTGDLPSVSDPTSSSPEPRSAVTPPPPTITPIRSPPQRAPAATPVDRKAPGFEPTPVSHVLPASQQEAGPTQFQSTPSSGASGLPHESKIPGASTEPQRPIGREPISSTRPRSVRLLDFFRRYAPDPHASMLRLSLRTGIPLSQLEQPEALSDEQVESIARSVRDILGQDQMSI